MKAFGISISFELMAWIIAILVIIIIVSWNLAQGKKRFYQMKSSALKLHYKFLGNASGPISSALKNMWSFYSHREGYVTHIISGEISGTKFYFFDFNDRDKETQGNTGLLHSVVLFHPEEKEFPSFILFPEDFLVRFTTLGSDIKFENEAFSKAFWISGKNEDAVKKFITPEIQSSLLDIAKGVCFEAYDHWLAIYQVGKQVAPEELQTFIFDTHKIYKMLTFSVK